MGYLHMNTLRLTILLLLTFQLPPNTSELALLVQGPLSVIKIFVDNAVTGASGTIGSSVSEEKPEDHLLIVPIYLFSFIYNYIAGYFWRFEPNPAGNFDQIFSS